MANGLGWKKSPRPHPLPLSLKKREGCLNPENYGKQMIIPILDVAPYPSSN